MSDFKVNVDIDNSQDYNVSFNKEKEYDVKFFSSGGITKYSISQEKLSYTCEINTIRLFKTSIIN